MLFQPLTRIMPGKSQFHKDAFDYVIKQERMNVQRKSTRCNALQLYIDFKCLQCHTIVLTWGNSYLAPECVYNQFGIHQNIFKYGHLTETVLYDSEYCFLCRFDFLYYNR